MAAMSSTGRSRGGRRVVKRNLRAEANPIKRDNGKGGEYLKGFGSRPAHKLKRQGEAV